jgi:hypothetical protein
MPSKRSKIRPKTIREEKSKIRTTGKNRFRWKYGKMIRTPRRK